MQGRYRTLFRTRTCFTINNHSFKQKNVCCLAFISYLLSHSFPEILLFLFQLVRLISNNHKMWWGKSQQSDLSTCSLCNYCHWKAPITACCLWRILKSKESFWQPPYPAPQGRTPPRILEIFWMFLNTAERLIELLNTLRSSKHAFRRLPQTTKITEVEAKDLWTSNYVSCIPTLNRTSLPGSWNRRNRCCRDKNK